VRNTVIRPWKTGLIQGLKSSTTKRRSNMYVKKNFILWAVVFALALPLVLANNAYAIYAGDGTKPNATGTWDITDYGKCVTGIESNGTMHTSAATSRPDCESTIVSALTGAACTGDSDANGGSHYATSVCIATGGSIDGQAVSLNGLDRTAGMCNQAAIKAGATSGAMVSNKCTGKWLYTGPAGDGAPGFCYTKADLSTDITGTTNCPTSKYGVKWDATLKCTYDYAIAGDKAFAALAKKDGSGSYVAAGASFDLSALTQGQCLFNGASWSTGAKKSGTDTTTAPATTMAVIIDTRAGCLECHNNTSQNNSYAGRWKSSYMLTGHKNMLRKVAQDGTTPWQGPDADGIMATYTAAAEGNVNMSSTPPTADVSEGAGKTLLYLFGDWMAPAPGGLDVIVNVGGYGKYNGGSNYSCAACHTAGWSNNDGVSGLCSNSSQTTQAACTGTWYPMVGRQGASYTPAEPAASFPGVTFTGAGKWDRDGITCSRCHESIFMSTGTNANGSTFTQAYGSTHNITPKSTVNEQVNNICYGCHQSVAKQTNGTGANADLSSPAIIPVKNNLTAPAYQPEFSGHVLGGSFLNSPHARFTGSITPNPLGKYDLTTNTTANYSSAFKGYVCRSSATAGSGSVLETVIKSGVVEEIKTLADCQSANSNTTVTGVWQAESQGSCTTCHDVHKSMFVQNQGEALRRECETCHEDTTGTGGAGYNAAGVPQIDGAMLAHPQGTNTPWDSARFANACETCHMPKATSGGFPMHLWRINTAATYTTFPSATEFGIGATATNKNANTSPDGSYTNAVWVDLDLSCGQCHSASGLNYVSGNPLLTKDQLAVAAAALHDNGPTANTQCMTCHNTAQGTHRAVNQGVDHHNGTCTTCHPASNGHFAAAMSAPNLTANILKPAGSHNPLPYWSINTTLRDACLSCHSTPQPKLAGGMTGTITPSGTGDNHHGGHSSVPGTSFGGVSEANGSRGDNDPGMNCLGCHGKSNIISGSSTTGYDIKIAASGLSTSVVAAANGRTNTTGLCMGCHEVIQSGGTQDHHVGDCLTCHHSDGSWSGTYGAGVGTATVAIDAASRDSVLTYCQQCHASAQGASRAIIPSGAGDNHHRGSGTSTARTVASCLYCHGEAGGVPFGTASTEVMADGAALGNTGSCSGACHSGAQAGAGDHHTGVGMSLTNNTYCLTCHTPTSNIKPGGTDPASYPPFASNSRDSVNTYCQTCHVSAQGSFRAIIPTGAGDNHHRGSGTSTARTVAGCLYCHGEAGGVHFGEAGTEVMADGAALGNTGSCSGACHSGAQAAAGDHHTGQGMSLTNNTYCLTCHTPTSNIKPGGTDPASYPPFASNSRDSVLTYCQSCHASAQGSFRAIVPSGTGDNHHRGSGTTTARSVASCLYCHGEAGGVAFGGAATEVMIDQAYPGTCTGVCHTVIQSGATWTTTAANHHPGSCTVCHAPTGPVAAGVTTPAFPPANVADCTACHGAMTISTMNHPVSAGTPTTCENCHASAGVKPVPDPVCGQCHGGSAGTTAVTNGAPYRTAAQLNSAAVGLHGASITPVARFNWKPDTLTSLLVNFDASASICPSIATSCSYGWDFGDGVTADTGAVKTTSHTYGNATTSKIVTLTVTANGVGISSTSSLAVIPRYIGPASPISLGTPTITIVGFTGTFHDVSTGGSGTVTIKIAWGDGKVDTMSQGGTKTHVYPRSKVEPYPYRALVYASDSGVTVNGIAGRYRSNVRTDPKNPIRVVVKPITITGLVTKSSGTTVLPYARLTLMQGTKTVKRAMSDRNGLYTFTNVVPNIVSGATTSTTPYTVVPSKTGFTFSPAISTGFTIAPNSDTASVTNLNFTTTP
jgi:hypothetical protein